jgi:hypothetical protein
MTNESKIQISGKVGDIIVLISGDTPAAFQDAVMSILGPDANEAVGAMFQTALLEKFATTNLIDAGMVARNQATPAQQAVTTPQTPATSSGPKEETDNWGNVYIYSIPGAPTCPHGARVQKKGTSKAGKPYTAFVCPTQTPSAYRNKVTKSDCSLEFSK